MFSFEMFINHACPSPSYPQPSAQFGNTQAMEYSSFDVHAFVFVETNPPNPRKVKEILVPAALLNSDESHMVALVRQCRPKLGKHIPILMAVTTDLKDFQVVDHSLQRISAHAVASCGKSVDTYLAGDQFFLINSLPKRLEVAKNFEVEIVNLRTGKTGFVPTAALIFYPHAKVVEEFEWSQCQSPFQLSIAGFDFCARDSVWRKKSGEQSWRSSDYRA